MLFSKKNIIILLFAVFLLIISPTLGRFIYFEVRDIYFRVQNFYFESDKLKVNKATYQVNNYNGVDSYNVVINLNSFKNNLQKATMDIAYEITFTCSNKAICDVDKDDGIIYSSNNMDTITITITPNQQLNNNDIIWMDVVAKSTSPYVKEISAIFILRVGFLGLSHEIADEVGSPYLEVKVANTLEYYRVIEAFGSYNVEDRINRSTYLTLSETDKQKCVSSFVNLSFDPDLIVIDMTGEIYLRSTNQTTQSIGGHNYLNGLTFRIDAQDSVIIRFYKKNSQQNYTFPIINPTSIVAVTYN